MLYLVEFLYDVEMEWKIVKDSDSIPYTYKFRITYCVLTNCVMCGTPTKRIEIPLKNPTKKISSELYAIIQHPVYHRSDEIWYCCVTDTYNSHLIVPILASISLLRNHSACSCKNATTSPVCPKMNSVMYSLWRPDARGARTKTTHFITSVSQCSKLHKDPNPLQCAQPVPFPSTFSTRSSPRSKQTPRCKTAAVPSNAQPELTVLCDFTALCQPPSLTPFTSTTHPSPASTRACLSARFNNAWADGKINELSLGARC